MTEADRWKSVERLYHAAVERPEGERPAFLEAACAGDEGLRREVESLLAHEGVGFLEEAALDVEAAELAKDGGRTLVGRRLRSYEVLAVLGTGGMGVVYRARDTTLGREVALKLLPRELSADAERLRRLEREARLLASLNHPGIATLHGLEEADGELFLVMELVAGPTLAERLDRGPLPVPEALAVGRQMAEALEAAHEKGVVHRDLKPANVKLTPEGRIKVLDFGLAKALESGETEEAARTDAVTREGTILGTPAYMSPEQARGQAVDRRTDIWAFGCCLYESLAGRRAFGGRSTADSLAAVLEREPEWGALPDAMPEGVRRLLRRCLTKEARLRLQHIGDARVELEEAVSGPAEETRPNRRLFRSARMALAGAFIGAVLTGVGSWTLWQLTSGRTVAGRPHSPVTRLTLRLDGGAVGDLRLNLGMFFVPFALSPDGSRLVFHARGPQGQQLFLRELSGFETKALVGTGQATTPCFSPDGRWIAFWRADDHKLWKVSVSGGSPIEIGVTGTPLKVLWGGDNEILFAEGGHQLWSISADGGAPREISVRDRSRDEWISLLDRVPGHRDLLIRSFRPGEGTWIEKLDRRSGERRRLLRGGAEAVARFTPTGHLVYTDGGTLFAVPLDIERLEPVGEPVPVIQGIDQMHIAFSDNGTVVYLPAERVRRAELVSVDRTGKTSAVPLGGSLELSSFAASPSGREAAIEVREGLASSVWILDLERGSKRLLAAEGRTPIFSRDGAFVTYVSSRAAEEVFSRRRADGTGDLERLFTHPLAWSTPLEWSPDGRTLLFATYSSRGDSDVWTYSAGKTSPLLASPSNEGPATFSPDGRFIAFELAEAGGENVYLQPFPGPGPRTPVSVGEGRKPFWGRDGRRLFYEGEQHLMVVPVQTAPVLSVGRPQAYSGSLPESREVVGDGRTLRLVPTSTIGGPQLEVVLNWFEELERLAPHPRR